MIPTAQTIGHMVWTPGATDSHGNPVDTWAAAVDVDVYGYAPPNTRAEAEPGGTQVITQLDVYAPAFTVDSRDRFVVGGVTYEVAGEIGDWDKGPFGYAPGIVIGLKRVEGGR